MNDQNASTGCEVDQGLTIVEGGSTPAAQNEWTVHIVETQHFQSTKIPTKPVVTGARVNVGIGQQGEGGASQIGEPVS